MKLKFHLRVITLNVEYFFNKKKIRFVRMRRSLSQHLPPSKEMYVRSKYPTKVVRGSSTYDMN